MESHCTNDMHPISILVVICWIITLAFGVRMVIAPGSERIRKQIRRHRLLHGVWGLLAVSTFVIFYYLPFYGAPDWIDRRTQRKVVAERIQSAGGWTALKKDCESLRMTHQNGFRWFGRRTPDGYQFRDGTEDPPDAPPAIAALKPQELGGGTIKEGPEAFVVKIKIFGLHSTGGHSTPYYGLEIVLGEGAKDYRPKPRGGVSGNRSSTYRKIADNIYEVY